MNILWTQTHLLFLLLLLFFFAFVAPILFCSFHKWFIFACNFYEWFHWNGLCKCLFSKRFDRIFVLEKELICLCSLRVKKEKKVKFKHRYYILLKLKRLPVFQPFYFQPLQVNNKFGFSRRDSNAILKERKKLLAAIILSKYIFSLKNSTFGRYIFCTSGCK